MEKNVLEIIRIWKINYLLDFPVKINYLLDFPVKINYF